MEDTCTNWRPTSQIEDYSLTLQLGEAASFKLKSDSLSNTDISEKIDPFKATCWEVYNWNKMNHYKTF